MFVHVNADFFVLFGGFRGFASSPMPGSVSAYSKYRQLAVDFVDARNNRILAS